MSEEQDATRTDAVESGRARYLWPAAIERAAESVVDEIKTDPISSPGGVSDL